MNKVMDKIEQNTYEQVAEKYVELLGEWKKQEFSVYYDLIIPQLLHYLGDVTHKTVLDAGCGEGYFSRLLADRGAQVTAIDISFRLIELAKAQDKQGLVDYQVCDLSKPLLHYSHHFDIVISNLVLNDVPDYIGYVSTLGKVTKQEGRVVLSMNNPYSAVPREKVQGYFDSGTTTLYEGLSRNGVKVYFFHRTFEEYITAFRNAGFLLKSLSDLPIPIEVADKLPEGKRQFSFPFFMALEFVKSAGMK